MPLYNRAEYDVQEYNASSLSLNLSDSSTLSSNLGGFSDSLTKIETISLLLTLSNLLSRQFSESLSVTDSTTLQQLTKLLAETISSGSSMSFSNLRNLLESVSLTETFLKLLPPKTLTDSLKVYDPESTQIDRYGSIQYNTSVYNSRMFGPRRKVLRVTTETLPVSDLTKVVSLFRALTESITLGSSVALTSIAPLLDAVFMSEFFKRELTNKALGDILELATWLEIERKPAQEVF